MKDKAIEIAKKAGKYLRNNYRTDESLFSERGVAKEITTRFDKESDRIIVSEIQNTFPDHSIISEESEPIEKESDYTWIIDSLDGSANFASGNPFFAISIGLMERDQMIIGVIYAPILNELYVAEKGKGAALNGKEIKVSDINTLDKSYIVSCEGGEPNTLRISKIFSNILPDVKDMRKIGSAALEAGLVASGRADGYITLSIYPWDVSAGVLLVMEAGGTVTDFIGKEWIPFKSDMIFSNGKIHSELLSRVE